MDGRCRIRLPRSGFVHRPARSKYHPPQKPLIRLTDLNLLLRKVMAVTLQKPRMLSRQVGTFPKSKKHDKLI